MRWILSILAWAAVLAAAIVLALQWPPGRAAEVGSARMLYLHIPAAVITLLAFTVAAVASLMGLWRQREIHDQAARAAVGTSLVMGTVMLASGMIWARMAWGHWWDFKSPRLMLSLVLWIMFVAYFILRGSLPDGRRRRKVAAVYCLIAYIDVPLVYLSARLAAGEIHPATAGSLVEKPSDMVLPLAVCFAAALATAALLFAALLRRARRSE